MLMWSFGLINRLQELFIKILIPKAAYNANFPLTLIHVVMVMGQGFGTFLAFGTGPTITALYKTLVSTIALRTRSAIGGVYHYVFGKDMKGFAFVGIARGLSRDLSMKSLAENDDEAKRWSSLDTFKSIVTDRSFELGSMDNTDDVESDGDEIFTSDNDSPRFEPARVPKKRAKLRRLWRWRHRRGTIRRATHSPLTLSQRLLHNDSDHLEHDYNDKYIP